MILYILAEESRTISLPRHAAFAMNAGDSVSLKGSEQELVDWQASYGGVICEEPPPPPISVSKEPELNPKFASLSDRELSEQFDELETEYCNRFGWYYKDEDTPSPAQQARRDGIDKL